MSLYGGSLYYSSYPLDSDPASLSTLIPPENFSQVSVGIYRSGFPTKKNFPFLKSLRLKTILYLCLEEYPSANLDFLAQNGIQLLQFGCQGNKEPFMEIPESVLGSALRQLISTQNQPILIHCNKGKHRTGCLVGIYRKWNKWSLSAIFEEYRRFAAPKERDMDQQFIELFDVTGIQPSKLSNQSNTQTAGQQKTLSQTGNVTPALTPSGDAFKRDLKSVHSVKERDREEKENETSLNLDQIQLLDKPITSGVANSHPQQVHKFSSVDSPP